MNESSICFISHNAFLLSCISYKLKMCLLLIEREAKQVIVPIVSYFFLKPGLFTDLIFWRKHKKRESNEFC